MLRLILGALVEFAHLLNYSSHHMAGLDRSAFDNKSVSFDEHINSQHNMWHYLYFIVMLKVKASTEFTGPESYVHQMIKVGAHVH